MSFLFVSLQHFRCTALNIRVPPRFAAFSSLGKKIMVLNPSSRVQADVHRTSAFNLSNLVGPISPNKKDIQLDVLFLCLCNTLDALPSMSGYRPDLLHFLPFGKKIMVLNPSSRVQADVHRTSAFNISNLVGPFSPNKKDIQLDVLFVWRYRPDLNWGMRVLQAY